MAAVGKLMNSLATVSGNWCKGTAAKYSHSSAQSPNFGIMFDIDGVIVRGKRVLDSAPEAFKLLVDPETKKFRVPTVFLTNAGNSLRQEKADKLSSWLNIPVSDEQVVLAHSPLRMFTEYHNKHVLVTGQGPVELIAQNLGFNKVTTIEQLRHSFPTLDSVDHKRRRAAPCSLEKYFPRLEAVVLFGEPVRWETSLQLLLDVLITNGQPSEAPSSIEYPHLPLLACNMDLQWMAEAVMPRFGHGAFLLCLENLYKKITGHEMIYTALIGKPSEITYRYAEHVLQQHAASLGIQTPIRNLYCIGDNVCTDIFGANLYNKYLHNRIKDSAVVSSHAKFQGSKSRSIDGLVTGVEKAMGAEQCYSILVETGVFSKTGTATLDHSPRDFLPVENTYQEPSYTTGNVLDAVSLIFQLEGWTK